MTPPPGDNPSGVLDDLRARGLFHQCTDEGALRAHLAAPRRLYNGFDPTADSLTIGNLVPMMLMRRFRAFGHDPVVLMGGATGRIGDPSGKDAERTLMSEERIEQNIAAQRAIFVKVLGEETRIVNNYDWFKQITFLEALRDIGKHFSVNEMIRRDAVKNRLEREGQGISYTEFSYMLLQAYDFLHLYDKEQITLQTAGADQWGNIVSGVDLIRRAHGHAADAGAGGPLAFGFTAPLLTKSDGGKFGKTESGAIWLSHKRPTGAPGTSPYAYFQFWLNTADSDVQRYLLIFTDLEVGEVTELCEAHAKAPQERAAQRTLARSATALLHGASAAQQAEAAGQALFSGEVAKLDREALEEVFASVPATEHGRGELVASGVALVDLLPLTSLCKSKREAREHLGAGAVTLNGRAVGAEDRLSAEQLLHGEIALLRRGKKAWHLTRWR